MLALPLRLDAQRFEQYFTSGQLRSHFLRQVNGRSHTTHSLLGSWDLTLLPGALLMGISAAVAQHRYANLGLH
jgi:hypothetical protein